MKISILFLVLVLFLFLFSCTGNDDDDSETTDTPGAVYVSNSIVGNLRYVPATGEGGFTQGSKNDDVCRNDDENQFTHILTRNIAVMENEITREMWSDLQSRQSSLPDDPTHTQWGDGMDNPVQMVFWYEALLFANLLSLESGLTRCYYTNSSKNNPIDASNYTNGSYFCDFDANGFRLPTEGEWEYFTRAGTTTTFSIDEPNFTEGSCLSCDPGTFPTLETVAVFCANNYHSQSSAVGSKNPNPWNLRDVHGNIKEWCWDWYGSYPSGVVTDYTGPTNGTERVIRSGSWGFPVKNCRSAERARWFPNKRFFDVGFRLVATIK